MRYKIKTRILEKTQAIDNERVAFVPRLSDEGIANKIIKQTIRINCSKNSEKLIAKNFFCPQSELRSIEYILEKISAGVSESIIELMLWLENKSDTTSLKIKRNSENTTDRKREIDRPAVDVLFDKSFWLLVVKNDTFLDTMRGRPLAINVRSTENTLIAI